MAAIESQQLLNRDAGQPQLIESAPNEDHVFRSKLPDIQISNHMPLHTYCFQNVARFPDRTCLLVGYSGKTYSYSKTHLLSKRTAAGLTKLGIRKGDVVMILLQNCPQFVFTFFGASMIGEVTTTANPFYTSAEIYKQLVASGAKLIVTQAQYVEKLKDIHEDFKVVSVDDPQEDKDTCLHFSLLSDCNEAEVPEVAIDPDDPVALPFSSGTTGLPKGVILTHKSLTSSLAQQVDGENPNLYLTHSDMVLCVLPLFHIYSLNSVLLCSVRAGSGVVLMHKFEIVTMLEQIEKHRVSVAPVVPPLVIALAKNPRVVLSGAAPLGKELEEALRSRVPQATLGPPFAF